MVEGFALNKNPKIFGFHTNKIRKIMKNRCKKCVFFPQKIPQNMILTSKIVNISHILKDVLFAFKYIFA